MSEAVLIPLVKGGKQPIPRAWSAPDADWEAWWDLDLQVPATANMGRRCDGLIVVDCDSPEAAKEWEGYGFSTPYVVVTPRGFHFYYGLPEGVTVKAGPWRGHKGIDIKSGPGHQVVCPPSRTEAGGYHWLNRDVAEVESLAPAPPGLLALFQESERSVESGTALSLIPEGGRNNELTSWAGFMRRRGYDDDAVGRVLHGLNRSLTETPLPPDEVQAIVQSSARWEAEEGQVEIVPEDEDSPLLLDLKDMTLPPPAAWLWKPYVPEGRLVLLDGAEGIGKGLFCAHTASCMSAGQWPDGGTERGRVLWLAAEDDPEEDVQRRMMALGYDKDEHESVWFLTVDPTFPKHLEHLEKLILDNGVRLVVMDPGRSYLSAPEGVEMSYNNEAALRPTLQQLNKLAKRTGATILFVHHWNKASDRKVQHRQGGSAAFAQVVRHRVSLAWVGTTEEGQGAFEVTKSNIGPKGGLRAYGIEAHVEYDTAVLRVGEPLTDADMDAWLRAREQAAMSSVEIDKGDLLCTWAEGHLLPGDKVPGKAELAARLSLSDPDVRRALADAEDEGRVTKHGNHYAWRG